MKIHVAMLASALAVAVSTPAWAAVPAAKPVPQKSANANAKWASSGPAQAVLAFFDAAKNKDKEALLEASSPNLKLMFSQLESFDDMPFPTNAKIKILDVKEDGDNATVSVEISSDDETETEEVYALRVGDAWKFSLPGEKPPAAVAAAKKGLSPDKVAIEFFKRIADADLAGASAYASEQTALLLNMAASMGDPSQIEKHPNIVFKVVSTKIDGDKATVSVHNSEDDETEDVTLVREGGEWKVTVDKDAGFGGADFDEADFDGIDFDDIDFDDVDFDF